MSLISRLPQRRWAGVLASSLLCALFAHGAWPLGFVALLPWLLSLDCEMRWRDRLLSGWLMSLGYTLAGFTWFAEAIARYTDIGTPAALAILVLAAPLLQPQVLLAALAREAARRLGGPWLAAVVFALAWVAAEAGLPRLLGDTYAYGLYPAAGLRQGAALVGASGLSLLLMLVQAALALALQRRGRGWRDWAPPAGMALLVPALMAAYGAQPGAPAAPVEAAQALRLGLIQSNITDYERLRRELGAGAVVRRVLDTHFAMSYDAVVNQKVDAVLWSETVYPTSFGNARSEAGAQFDREIQAIVNSAGVPFVFGTYERTLDGEYNAAAFVEPQRGLLGFYRKTRLFPLTEYLPPWLEGLREHLPWAGHWLAGDGARVLPLRLADGREVPVQPLICRDDMDAGLALDGARLGAQALLTLSNDAWFPERGAALHLAAAAFRSIETGLPQYRVTPSGHSAVIDARGQVIAGSRFGEQTLVIGALPVGNARPTPLVRRGDWVGRGAAAGLALLALLALARRCVQGPEAAGHRLPESVWVLSPLARGAAMLLRAVSRGSLLAMIGLFLVGDGSFNAGSLAQLRGFAAWCLVPETAAWLLLRSCRARLELSHGRLRLQQGRRRLKLALAEVTGIVPWRLPLPAPGASLRLKDGKTWPQGLAGCDAWQLARALGQPVIAPLPTRACAYLRSLRARPAGRIGSWLAQPAVKFAALPVLLAIPAFRLHQQIAYGSPTGEWTTYGATAYVSAFGLWWAAWVLGVALCAAALRAAIEAGMLAGALLQPARAARLRPWLEAAGLAGLYLGLPAWLALRVLG